VGGRGGGSVGVEESTLPSVSLSLAREGLSKFSTPSVWGAGKHAPVVTGPIGDTLAREGVACPAAIRNASKYARERAGERERVSVCERERRWRSSSGFPRSLRQCRHGKVC